MPLTPPPTMATSTTPCVPFFACTSASRAIACTARAPVSAENLRSGTPVRSPTTRTPGTRVVPSSLTSGSFSTVPAGHPVCSQRTYLASITPSPASSSYGLRRTLWIGFACARLRLHVGAHDRARHARRSPRRDGGAREEGGIRRHPDQRGDAARQGGEEAAARDRGAHRRGHPGSPGGRQGGDRGSRLRQHLRA